MVIITNQTLFISSASTWLASAAMTKEIYIHAQWAQHFFAPCGPWCTGFKLIIYNTCTQKSLCHNCIICWYEPIMSLPWEIKYPGPVYAMTLFHLIPRCLFNDFLPKLALLLVHIPGTCQILATDFSSSQDEIRSEKVKQKNWQYYRILEKLQETG